MSAVDGGRESWKSRKHAGGMAAISWWLSEGRATPSVCFAHLLLHPGGMTETLEPGPAENLFFCDFWIEIGGVP
jgi:hypothetical protein